MHKPKKIIERKFFYLKITLLSISTILMMFWILEALIIGTKQYDNLPMEIASKAYEKYVISKWIAFIINSILLISFLINLLISKRNGVGYLFTIWWIIVFVGLIASLHSTENSHENNLRITISAFQTIVFIIFIFLLIYLLREIFNIRRNYKYEQIKIHKGKK